MEIAAASRDAAGIPADAIAARWNHPASASSDGSDFRRLDRGPQARAERPSFHDKLLIVERRSLHSALRAPVETTKTLVP